MNMGMAALELAEKMFRTSEQNATRRCPYCKGTGHKQGPPLNHAPDTVIGVGYPKCSYCKGTGRSV